MEVGQTAPFMFYFYRRRADALLPTELKEDYKPEERECGC
jgi:hypothetical protein